MIATLIHFDMSIDNTREISKLGSHGINLPHFYRFWPGISCETMVLLGIIPRRYHFFAFCVTNVPNIPKIPNNSCYILFQLLQKEVLDINEPHRKGVPKQNISLVNIRKKLRRYGNSCCFVLCLLSCRCTGEFAGKRAFIHI